MQDAAHHLHVLLQLLTLFLAAGRFDGWIIEAGSTRDDLEEELLDGFPVVVGIGGFQLFLEFVDLLVELLSVDLILLDELLYLVLVEVFDTDEAVLLLLGSLEFVLQGLNLNFSWFTCLLSSLFY